MPNFKLKENVPCYSPLPPKAYRTSLTLLDSDELWNLAYLSHDFENDPYHRDPGFTALVRRTAQFQLDGSGFDLINSGAKTIKDWLRLPPGRFVKLVTHFKHLSKLPLYQAYGHDWLETIQQRAVHCVYEQAWDLNDLPANVVAEAQRITEQAIETAARRT